MRNLLAALGVFGLGIALGSAAWAQDDKKGTDNPAQKRDQDQNQNQDQDRNKNRSGPQTVRGVVAGITAEGELAIDYRTGRAVMVQAAYLTVVGSPAGRQEGASKTSSKPGDPDRRDKDQAKGKDNDSDKDRDNVYIVWLSPRTKVYEASGDSGKPGQKKEAPLSRLEIGDPVEIQFNPREQSDADPGANQTEKMRSKHGRERIFVGDATEITILPSEDEDKSSQDSKKPGAEGSDRDKDQ